MNLEQHFEIVDSYKNILLNANDERQEKHARQLLASVIDMENYIYVGGGK